MIETLLQLSIIVGIIFFVVWVASPDKDVETYKKYIKDVIESTISLYPDQKDMIIYIRNFRKIINFVLQIRKSMI